ncbi:MAG: thioredoxin family protein [Phycisphaeraceae bacterium]|nr:MAG: thioredoxin family protein [Phycisphaeraceae bacterium]
MSTPALSRISGLPRLLAALLVLASLAPSAVGQLGKQSPFGSAFGGPMGDDEPPVEVRVIAGRDSVTPGGQLVLAVVLDHAEHFHTNPHEPVVPPEMEGFLPIATEITVTVADNAAEVGPIQWPQPKAVEVNFTGSPVKYLVYTGKAVAYVPVRVSAGATAGGTLSLSVETSYQACNDTSCLPPDSDVSQIQIPIVEVGVESKADDLFAGFDPSVFAAAWGDQGSKPGAATSAGGGKFFGLTIPGWDEPIGLALLFVFGALGGFILNLTPCVLPVIPIKVMTISQHAGSPGKSLYLGLWMFAGVVAFWLALGVLASSVSTFADPSRLFGYWQVTLGIGVLILAMGVGIMGAFSINLPKQVYMVNPKADSAPGSFMFGVMTAVLGLPCFGFVAGALLAGSAAMPGWVVLVIFLSLGVGMGLPYLVLAAKPQWVDKIPRTGPASELVKQVMGLLLLAAGAYFAGSGVLVYLKGDAQRLASLPWWTKAVHWWVVGVFAVAAGAWLTWRTVRITPKPIRRVVFGLVGLVLAAGGVLAGIDQTLKARSDIWSPFTQAHLDAGLASGKVVVLDFTADWCLNCKAIESAVLLKNPVKSELLSTDVLPLKADLTSTKAPGWDKLRDLGRTGIPTLAVFGPGLGEPWVASAYTPEQVVHAIEQARGKAVSAAGG